jgi:hypothetical protein
MFTSSILISVEVVLGFLVRMTFFNNQKVSKRCDN